MLTYENCNGRRSQLVNTRLHLPECWTDDAARCERVGIPEAPRHFRTKEELALEMVDDAVEQGLRFGWVGADTGYGKGLRFMLGLEERNLKFAVDVHRNQRMFLQRPHPKIPSKKATRGRVPSRYTVEEKSIRVDEWVASVPEKQWERVKVRDSSKGDLVYEVLCRQIFVWDEELGATPRKWWLVVRRNAESKKDYKYTFINASPKAPKRRLAFMQAQRYWIEHAFEVCKSDCGMADYEVRSWTGWHHHIALSMMAQLFLLTEAIRNQEDTPLLSPRDIMLLLAVFLPQKKPSLSSVVEAMESRHRQREKTRLSAVKKHKRKGHAKVT